MNTTPCQAAPAAPLRRRLAALLYEGVLLFGVSMVAAGIYAALTQQRHALQGKIGLQFVLVAVLGLYFTWFWTHGGQTLAMQTWRVRLQRADGMPVGIVRALVRYVLAWLWFVPGLLAAHLAGLAGVWPITAVVLTGMVAYATATRLHPDRQFPHDAICGTRLVDVPRPATAAKRA